MKKIAIITTQSSSIENWIKPFLPYYRQEGIAVTVLSQMDEAYRASLEKEFPGVTAVPAPIPRGVDLFGSLRAVRFLYRFFHRQHFDMVQYSTPNASFYGSVASFFARVPVRLYCQWGMVFVSQSGLKRKIFETIERTTCRLSTCVQPDSFGNLNFCREKGFYDETKSEVIWNGSAKGVDLAKFDLLQKERWRQEVRRERGIQQDDKVIGFVGRLGRDKGCNELFDAFRQISEAMPQARLLFVGPIEKEDTIDDLAYFQQEPRIIKTGRVPDVWRYYAAMDVFCLPSYREGFGMSVVEAEAMGVPVIVTDIPGPTDGMQEGKTGLVIPVRSAQAIVKAAETLLTEEETCRTFGENGAAFARNAFDSRVFARKLMENRKKLLSQGEK